MQSELDFKENTTVMTPQEHVRTLLQEIGKGLYEKDHLLALGLLCAISGESFFLLGMPGTAKSEVSRRLKLVFKDATSFEYLMSRFSTPDEIFGPVSIRKLKDADIYERQIEDYLPDADVVFLDEIWKAGPAIQNSLLTVLNEKIYKNGKTTIKLPMKLLVAASNEIPEAGSGLEALWDRFIVRSISECVKKEDNFYQLMRKTSSDVPQIPDYLLITTDLYANWQKQIQDVTISKDILLYLTQLRKLLAQKDEEDHNIYISDRRWTKIGKLLRTSAFLNGRKEIIWSDLLLLRHCIWNEVKEIPRVTKDVLSAATYSEYKALTAVEHQLNTISKQRVWRVPYEGQRLDAKSQETKDLLPNIGKELEEAAGSIMAGIDRLSQDDNLFISDFDWKLVATHTNDLKNRINMNRKKLNDEKVRFS